MEVLEVDTRTAGTKPRPLIFDKRGYPRGDTHHKCVKCKQRNFEIMKIHVGGGYFPRRVFHCLSCDIAYYRFGKGAGRLIAVEVPKDEIATFKFKRAIRIQKLIDRIPVTFGPPGSYHCSECQYPFHTGRNLNKNRTSSPENPDKVKAEAIVNHYSNTHPFALPHKT